MNIEEENVLINAVFTNNLMVEALTDHLLGKYDAKKGLKIALKGLMKDQRKLSKILEAARIRWERSL